MGRLDDERFQFVRRGPLHQQAECDGAQGSRGHDHRDFTFEGYADAYDEAVVKLEFSMDNGKTWTPYDLGQTDPSKWVYWHYTWTPESDGSYVLMVRGTTDTGLVGTNIQKVMVTAKSNVEG